jgi:hypothetical protein
LICESDEEAKLDQNGAFGILRAENLQGLVDPEELVVVSGAGEFRFVKHGALQALASLGSILGADAVEENPAHRFRRGAKELLLIRPARAFPFLAEPQVGLVQQGGAGDGLAGTRFHRS